MRIETKKYALLVGVFFVVIFIREPLFLLQPRIWAEEGAVYLAAALNDGPLVSFRRPHLGYYSLFNNAVASIASTFVPLYLAAHITTYASLMIQLVTLLIIATNESKLLTSEKERVTVAFALLICSTPEVWLNTINMHYWFATGTFFLLNSKRLHAFQLSYLAISFFTGVSSLFFAPFFLFRYLESRAKGFLLAFLVGSAAFIVQAASAMSYLSHDDRMRFKAEYVSHLPFGLASLLEAPFKFITGYHFPQKVQLAAIAVFLMVTFLHLRRADKSVVAYCILPIVAYSILTAMSSLLMFGGPRYALPVTAAIFSGMILMAKDYLSDPKHLAIPLLFLILNLPLYFTSTAAFYDPNWPNWQAQVSNWDRRSSMKVAIFPQRKDDKWEMTLYPK